MFVILQGSKMNKMQQISLNNLYYLGSRNYIQGGTIYELLMPEILKIFPTPKNFDFTYRSVINKDLVFYTQKQDREIKIVLRLEYKEEVYKLYGYYKLEAKDITQRIPYDEEGILKNAKLQSDNIYLTPDLRENISVVRFIIAMNKVLLSSLFKEQIKNFKWFLSRLTLNCVIDESKVKEIHLKYISRFEFHLVKTEIFINQESQGFIYFSLKGEDYVS